MSRTINNQKISVFSPTMPAMPLKICFSLKNSYNIRENRGDIDICSFLVYFSLPTHHSKKSFQNP